MDSINVKTCRIPGSLNTNIITCVDISYVNMLLYFYRKKNAHIWVNLTNGIECIDYLNKASIPYNYCRFTSTAFEQKKWSSAIDCMPDDMLMGLALGQQQVIVDFGANKVCPRALRQGIPIASRIISKVWKFNQSDRMYVYSKEGELITVDKEFESRATYIDKRQTNRLKYFKKYIPSDVNSVNLTGICAPTQHDGDYNYYSEMVKKETCANL